MATHSIAPPLVERRKPRQRNPPRDYGWTLYLIVITLLMVAGYIMSRQHLYKSGDRIGYNLGLAGGLMMLTLLLYPLRKRVGFMRNWVILPTWFKWHMVFGVLGPALVLFHTTFHIGSINAAMTLLFMMIVSGSGIFGRFFYTKVHWGLYGRQASYQQLQEDLEGYGNVKSIFSFAPEIQQKLLEFRDYAMNAPAGRKPKLWTFITLDVRAKFLFRALDRELEEAMYGDALEKNWNSAQMKLLDELYVENRTFIRSYLTTIRDLSQFETYVRLFSLWYFFHVPPVVMLVMCAIWHVVAVHMY